MDKIREELESDDLMACIDALNAHIEESEVKEEVREDVFSTVEEAESRAKKIGCVGTHSHGEDGEIVYMPCKTHDEYTKLTGREISGYKPNKKPDDEDDKSSDFAGFDSRKRRSYILNSALVALLDSTK